MTRRLFLAAWLVLATPSVADISGPPRRRIITWRVAWPPMEIETRTGEVDHPDRWGVWVREPGKSWLIHIRYDQIVR